MPASQVYRLKGDSVEGWMSVENATVHETSRFRSTVKPNDFYPQVWRFIHKKRKHKLDDDQHQYTTVLAQSATGYNSHMLHIQTCGLRQQRW